MAEALYWMQAFVLLRLCLSSGALSVASETGTNYYGALNLAPTATDSQIKKNFRQLALKYHPDKNKSSDAEKTFRAIIEGKKKKKKTKKLEKHDPVYWGRFVLYCTQVKRFITWNKKVLDEHVSLFRQQ